MEPPSSHSIVILNESGRRVPRGLIARAVTSALDLHGARPQEVVILLTTDEVLWDLNRKFRKLDEPTDVLTFPADADLPGPHAPTNLLGEIAIAVPYAQRQAERRRVSISQELGYLAIHGTLHLLGFDDERPTERARMVAEMNRVATAAGLKPDEDWASLLHDAPVPQAGAGSRR